MATTDRKFGFTTRQLHAGYTPEETTGSRAVQIGIALSQRGLNVQPVGRRGQVIDQKRQLPVNLGGRDEVQVVVVEDHRAPVGVPDPSQERSQGHIA